MPDDSNQVSLCATEDEEIACMRVVDRVPSGGVGARGHSRTPAGMAEFVMLAQRTA